MSFKDVPFVAVLRSVPSYDENDASAVEIDVAFRVPPAEEPAEEDAALDNISDWVILADLCHRVLTGRGVECAETAEGSGLCHDLASAMLAAGWRRCGPAHPISGGG